MASFERSVKGGTKVKLAPPKSKYVEHILLATQSGEAGVAEVFRTLTYRLRDSTWTVAFKSLIIVHLMIKEGARDVTLSYLSVAPKNRLAINHITEVQTQGQNIKRYSEYLLARAEAYGHAKCDYVRSADTRLKRLTVDKGLLKETEIVQEQVRALLKCDLLSSDVENEISLTAFRLLTGDLLELYNVENEAVMNVLSHYFEMSKPDAHRAIQIYKRFCTETEEMVRYLNVARRYEYATRLQIPKIKHAPTGLTKSLQAYLDDKDFEVNRRQYLAEQEAKRTGKPVAPPVQSKEEPKAEPSTTTAVSQPKARETGATTSVPHKGPALDLIDFFASIEQNQETLAQSVPQFHEQQQQPSNAFPAQFITPEQQQQHALAFQQAQQYPNGFAANANPFGQLQQQQSQPTLQQFPGDQGVYGSQPQSQYSIGNVFGQQEQPAFASPVQMQSPALFQAPQQTGVQSTNPFRQSTLPPGGSPVSFNPAAMPPPQRQGTNPFARNIATAPTDFTAGAFPQQTQPIFLPSRTASPPPMQAQPTGTNPFARNLPTQPHANTAPAGYLSPLPVQQTGTTNPFRQSAFVNQQTGQGWQYAPQPTLGGFENLDTIPVFPRPA